MIFKNSQSFACELDQQDPLKKFRDYFIMPAMNGKEQIYFLGNSLGLQPKNTAAAIHKILNQWSAYGVEGFFVGDHPWLYYHDKLTGPLANITGALPSEVIAMNQLTVNLHLMMVSFYRPEGKRIKILCEAKAFPSDQYMFETHVRHYGFDPVETIVEVSPREGEHCLRTDDILLAIDRNKDELAMVLFSGLNYYTGQVFDMKTITAAAQTAGAKVGFDLAHAAGNIPLQLHDWNVDFACWCTYKYLNSGPGAIGGVFIHEKHHLNVNIPRFGGWWGYDRATRFKMKKGFKPIPTAEGWQLSTPSMLLYASHKAALDIFEEAGMEKLHNKRKLLSGFLWHVLDEINSVSAKKTIEYITPRGENEKGCQVSMLISERGREIFDKLSQSGVMSDWREPNVIRIAPVPLYNSFEEVWLFGNILRQIIE